MKSTAFTLRGFFGHDLAKSLKKLEKRKSAMRDTASGKVPEKIKIAEEFFRSPGVFKDGKKSHDFFNRALLRFLLCQSRFWP